VLDEDTLNAAIDDHERAAFLTDRERAIMRFVDAFAERPDEVGADDYDALKAHCSEEEIVELLIFLVMNLGMHVFFGTLDFYPMFGPDGSLVSQEESRMAYGDVPEPLGSSAPSAQPSTT
jgi:hypothetical protein